jgi:hypothetical protein
MQESALPSRRGVVPTSNPLGETDPFSLPPMLTENVKVCCDVCHQEYSYSPKEVLRAEIEVPEHITAHPLFR